MKKQDVQRLFRLIETLYPGSKRDFSDPAVLEAWALVLSPWEYGDAKQAVIDRARENRFAPDVSELAAYLPKPSAPPEEPLLPEPSPAHLAAFYRRIAEPLRAAWRDLGIPSPSEAKRNGIPYEAWCAMADHTKTHKQEADHHGR